MPKKLKIILSIPLALFFIANIFYYPLPAKAEEVCKWINPSAPEYQNSKGFSCTSSVEIYNIGDPDSGIYKCKESKDMTCKKNYKCICCCNTVTPSTASPGKINATMPKLKIPDIKLQVIIPGLNLTKGDAIKCTETNGKKTCNFPWIGEYIAGIYKYAIGIVGILAAVVLMVGGVLWIIAGGNATTIGEAKAWIGASLTGLVIALTSYLILYQVNPALVGFKGLDITMVEKIKQLVEARTGGTAEQYKNMPCPTSSELSTGVQIYTTGYYHPPYGTDRKSLCMIHMSCSCPESVGINNQENCDDIFPNNKNYHPCNYIPPNIPYCNKTASPGNPPPHLGVPTTVAAPDCIDFGTRLCIEGKNYIVEDRGDDIQGKRIDIWSGDSIDTARSNSGLATMKIGVCQQ